MKIIKKKCYRFKQPFFTVKLVNFLQCLNYKLFKYRVIRVKIHNFIEKFRSHRCSILVDGEYVFSPEKARKIKPSSIVVIKNNTPIAMVK